MSPVAALLGEHGCERPDVGSISSFLLQFSRLTGEQQL